MPENPLNITALNDFIFCPISIYFHGLYSGRAEELIQDKPQLDGKSAHKNIDENNYTGGKDILASLEVYSEKYNLIGKIDMYNKMTKTLIERKNSVKQIYDGYVYQLYAQYFAMQEMGYKVEKIKIHSIMDNKNYNISLPNDDEVMLKKFEKVVCDIQNFSLEGFNQTNKEKCSHCIYSNYCDREAM